MGEFEKDIRDMFVDFEVPIDTENLWREVEGKLDKKKRKFGFWWIFSGTAVLIIVFVLGIVFFNNSQGNTQNKGLNLVKNQSNTSFDNTDKENKIKKNTNEIEESTIAKLEDSENKNITEKRNHYHNNNNNNTPIAGTNILENNNINNIQVNNNIYINNNKYISIYNKNDYNNKSTALKSIYTDKYGNDIKLVKSFGLKNAIKSIEYSREEFDITGLVKHQYFDIDGKKSNNLSFSYAMDFDLGVAFAEKYLKSTSQDYNYYKKQRMETESLLEAFCSNILFNVRHKSGLFIRTGINFTQIDELFSDIDSIDIEKNTNGVTEVFTDEKGEAIASSGELKLIEHRVWNMNMYNYYRFLDIPLYLGYSINFNKAILEIESGISYNILFLRKGQIVGEKGFPVDISEGENIFKTSTGLNLMSGIRFLYPIKGHLFYIEPNLRYSLQKITADEYPLPQKYLNYGVKLGYRMSF